MLVSSSVTNVSLVRRVGEDVVVDVPVRLEAFAEIFLLLLGEDVDRMRIVDRVVGEMLDDDRGLLLVDERAGLSDEIFGVRLELAEPSDVDSLQNGRNRLAGQLRVLGQFADQVVLHGGVHGGGHASRSRFRATTKASPFFIAS